MAGKQFTDLTKASALKDTNIIAVHDGNGLKKSSMEDVTIYMADKFRNQNLLINPDFKINQRGQAEYAYQTSGAIQYTVDRFRVVFLSVKTASDGLILNANGTNADGGYISQVLEDAVKGDTVLSFKVSAVVGTIEFRNVNSEDEGNTVTISSDGTYTVKGNNTKKVIAHITKGSSCKIEWVKLEHGSIATPFVDPNPAEELVKCERFMIIPILENIIFMDNSRTFYMLKEDISKMRIIPTVKTNEKVVYTFIISYYDGTQKRVKCSSITANKYGELELKLDDNILTKNKLAHGYLLTQDSIGGAIYRGLILDAEIY